MPVTTWIRDILGIRKDVIDAKKAKLEVTRLQDEEDARRGLIDLATLNEIKKYDPKVKKLERRIELDDGLSRPHHLLGVEAIQLIGCALVALVILAVLAVVAFRLLR